MLVLAGTKLYLVMGELSGWEWPVAAYYSHERAEKHRWKAQHAAQRLWAACRELNHIAQSAVRNPYDNKHCSAVMYGVEYRVEEIPLLDDQQSALSAALEDG